MTLLMYFNVLILQSVALKVYLISLLLQIVLANLIISRYRISIKICKSTIIVVHINIFHIDFYNSYLV